MGLKHELIVLLSDHLCVGQMTMEGSRKWFQGGIQNQNCCCMLVNMFLCFFASFLDLLQMYCSPVLESNLTSFVFVCLDLFEIFFGTS